MKPARDQKYLAWIRTLPCLICGRTAGIEAAHTGPHGMAQKSPDSSAIPLCARHHRTGRDSYHKLGPHIFERHHGIDIRAVVTRLTTKPSIRIEFGMFLGRYLGEEYVLGPVHAGLSSAVRKILLVKLEDRTWRWLESAQPDLQEFFRIRNRLQRPRRLTFECERRLNALSETLLSPAGLRSASVEVLLYFVCFGDYPVVDLVVRSLGERSSSTRADTPPSDDLVRVSYRG